MFCSPNPGRDQLTYTLSKMPLLLLKPNCQRSSARSQSTELCIVWPLDGQDCPSYGSPMDRGRQGRLESFLESGCLTSLWPLAVAATDELKLLRRNRKI